MPPPDPPLSCLSTLPAALAEPPHPPVVRGRRTRYLYLSPCGPYAPATAPHGLRGAPHHTVTAGSASRQSAPRHRSSKREPREKPHHSADALTIASDHDSEWCAA